MTIPVAPKTGFQAIGIGQKVLYRDTDVWMLLIETDAPAPVIAKLIGVMLLDDKERILHPQFMPDHPPTVFLNHNGDLRQGRGFLLAPWAEAEIARLAEVLLRDHASYLSEVTQALNQRDSHVFRPLEPGFFFSTPIGSEHLGPIPTGVEVDVSRCERIANGFEWYQIATSDYFRNPYLALLTEDELARRVEDVMGNIHIVDPQGLVSLDSSDPYLPYWLLRLNDVKAEMARRHGPYPAGWKRGMIDFARMPGSLTASQLAKKAGLLSVKHPQKPFLVKYGVRQHMETMLSKGLIRVSPASSYSDPSLNNALRDDELRAETRHDPYVPFNDAAPGTVLFPPGRVKTQLELNTNFYVYSMADVLSVRLLLDFGYDACVLIRDPDSFLERLLAAVKTRLPDWHSRSAHVEYYDPLLVHPAQIEVAFWKHFRQAYQREVRVAWFPRSPATVLTYFDINLGSLVDIAELITLD